MFRAEARNTRSEDPVLSGVIHLHQQGNRCGLDPYYVRRFGLLMDPLGRTGFVWFALRTLTGLSQYPVFKVQAAADNPHILRFSPLRAAQLAFGARKHITHSPLPCQQVFATYLRSPSNLGSPPSRRCEERLPTSLGGAHKAAYRPQVRGCHAALCDRLHAAFRFQHALRSPVVSGGAARVLYHRMHAVRKGAFAANRYYPRYAHHTRRHDSTSANGASPLPTGSGTPRAERSDGRIGACLPVQDAPRPRYARGCTREAEPAHRPA